MNPAPPEKPEGDSEPMLERLEVVSLAEILRRQRVAGASGTLMVSGPTAVGRFGLLNGELVSVQSPAEGLRLGEFLVARGQLTAEAMARVLDRADGREAFGSLLLRNGLLTPARLEEGLTDLARAILAGTLALEEGTVAFRENVFPVRKELHRTFAPSFFLEAVRAAPASAALARAVASAGPDLAFDPEARAATPLVLDPGEYYVLSRCEGESFSAAAVRSVVTDKSLADRTLAGLLLSGWIVPAAERTRARRRSGRHAMADTREAEIASFAERMEQMSYYELLGVARGASQSEIKSAYEKLRAAYEHEDGSVDYRYFRRKVLIRLDEAFAILGEPDRRKGYDRLGTKAGGETVSKQLVERRELQRSIAVTNFEKARELFDAGDVFPALQLVQQASVFDPENVDYLWLLARCQLKNPKWINRAVETMQKLVALDPSQTEAWMELGQFFLHKHLNLRAEGCFREVLKYDRESTEAKAGLAASRRGTVDK